jgi:glucose-6-phosphate 1-dehydrogenase
VGSRGAFHETAGCLRDVIQNHLFQIVALLATWRWGGVPWYLGFGKCLAQTAGEEFVGDQRELYLLDEQAGEEAPYERLLGDAMAGNGALFTREDAVEAAWAVVDAVLIKHHPVRPYERGSWGPKEADALLGADGSWHNPHADGKS